VNDKEKEMGHGEAVEVVAYADPIDIRDGKVTTVSSELIGPYSCQLMTVAQHASQPDTSALVGMVDRAMVEMQNIYPPMRRRDCERLIRAAYQPAPADAAMCKWTRDEDTGAYDTQCGATWHLSDGDDPAEHGQYFCHHCGRPIDNAQQRTDDEGGV
jgi:hypothetical protein